MSLPNQIFVVLAVAIVLAACAYKPARFADRPPTFAVRDDEPIALPGERRLGQLEYLNDAYLRTPIVGALDVERTPPAEDVNSFDEVPRSSWYTGWTGDSAMQSYRVDGPPRPPLIVETGATLTQKGGLRAIDARGVRYELHRDPPKLPETSTAASAIASRLVHLLGYRTPEVWVVDLGRGSLLDSPARSAGYAAIEAFLKDGPPAENGRYRISATGWPKGLDAGNTDSFGTRNDDPNDRIRHEDRRTLRALKLVAEWLDVPKLSPYNTRDAYVGEPGRGHLVHYVTGLENTLGAARLRGHKPVPSPTGNVRGGFFTNLFTLGLIEPDEIKLRRGSTLEALSSEANPESYEPPYEPSRRMRPDDGYWIAKHMADISEQAIQWAIDSGKLSDADVRDAVLHALDSRRNQIVAYAFKQVTAVEPVQFRSKTLVLFDEALVHKLVDPTSRRYLVDLLSDTGRALAKRSHASPEETLVRVPIAVDLMREHDYLVVRVTAEHEGRLAPRPFEAHLLQRGKGAWRIVGVRH